MKNREIITALGLTVAISMSGCSACSKGEPQPEVVAVAEEAAVQSEIEEDTQIDAPVITAKSDIAPVALGTALKPEDYVECDQPECYIYFVAEDGDHTSIDVPSELDSSVTEITYTVAAVNSSDLRSEEISVSIPVLQPEKTEIAESEEAVVEDTEPETPALDYEIEPMDDTIMYAQQNCNVRSGPSTDYDKVGSLSLNQEVTVNGKVTADNGKVWYVIKPYDDSTQMVSGSLLGPNKVQQQQKPSGGGNSSQPGGGNGNGESAQPAQTGDCDSDCVFSDCSDCEGDCISGLEYRSDCIATDCSDSWCAQAE